MLPPWYSRVLSKYFSPFGPAVRPQSGHLEENVR